MTGTILEQQRSHEDPRSSMLDGGLPSKGADPMMNVRLDHDLGLRSLLAHHELEGIGDDEFAEFPHHRRWERYNSRDVMFPPSDFRPLVAEVRTGPDAPGQLEGVILTR